MGIKVIAHDNDQRPTLFGSHKFMGEIFTSVFANGYTSSSVDIFPNACKDVYIRFVTPLNGVSKIEFGATSSATSTERNKQKLLFEACLGDADQDWTNDLNKESYDKGSSIYPHVIMAYELTQYNCYSYSPWPNAQWNSDVCDDEYDITIPSNTVCDNIAYSSYPNGVSRFGSDKFCANKNPSGIVLMVTKSGDDWVIRNKVVEDYGLETPFAIRHMDGIFKNVNINVVVVSIYDNRV